MRRLGRTVFRKSSVSTALKGLKGLKEDFVGRSHPKECSKAGPLGGTRFLQETQTNEVPSHFRGSEAGHCVPHRSSADRLRSAPVRNGCERYAHQPSTPIDFPRRYRRRNAPAQENVQPKPRWRLHRPIASPTCGDIHELLRMPSPT